MLITLGLAEDRGITNVQMQQLADAVASPFNIPQLTRYTVNQPYDLADIYGLPLDDPMSAPTDCLRYDACLALGVSATPQPLRSFALPAGNCARLRHMGPYDGLEAATQTLVGGWLPASGWQAADFPTIHQFNNNPRTHTKDLVTNILLPLISYPE